MNVTLEGGKKATCRSETIQNAKNVLVISSIRCTGIQLTRRTNIGPRSYFGNVSMDHYGLRTTKMRAENLAPGLVRMHFGIWLS